MRLPFPAVSIRPEDKTYPEEPEGLLVTGSPACVLLLDDGHCRSRPGCIRPQTTCRGLILANHHHRRAAEEFGRLVENTIRRIELADFLPHSGIRFPQNPCNSCPYVGLCLGKQEMADASLERRPGAESLDWLDELNY